MNEMCLAQRLLRLVSRQVSTHCPSAPLRALVRQAFPFSRGVSAALNLAAVSQVGQSGPSGWRGIWKHTVEQTGAYVGAEKVQCCHF